MIQRIHDHHRHFPPSVSKVPRVTNNLSFDDVLSSLNIVKLSKHASQRLNEREIQINEQQWQKITTKMNEAKQKGVTESLILTDEAALLVSTTNNTVITAMTKTEASTQIFTNINGTILINN